MDKFDPRYGLRGVQPPPKAKDARGMGRDDGTRQPAWPRPPQRPFPDLREDADGSGSQESPRSRIAGRSLTEGVRDDTSLAGLRPEDLTSPTRMVLLTLLEEIGRVRADLSLATGRERHLTSLADSDPVLPVLNRRALLRELDLRLDAVGQGTGGGAIAYFRLTSLPGLLESLGLAAADAAMTCAAEALTWGIRQSDVVASVGGPDLVVLLAGAGGSEAAAKAESLARLVATRPFSFAGRTLALAVAHGVHPLRIGDSAVDALGAAEAACRHRRPPTRQGTAP